MKSCHSSELSMGNRPTSSGKTKRVTSVTFPRGRGASKGDPLMLQLFCLAQHAALRAVADQLAEGEHLFAFLDDLHIVCHPDRVGEIHSILQRELFRHAHISVHLGKTKIWNRSGDEPEGCCSGGPVSCGLERGSHPPSLLPRSQNPLVSSGPPELRQCSVVGEVRFPFSSPRSYP